jgi:hypothetical protein
MYYETAESNDCGTYVKQSIIGVSILFLAESDSGCTMLCILNEVSHNFSYLISAHY